MKSFLVGTVAALALVVSASAQTQTKPTPPAKPDQTKPEQGKPDAKPAADAKSIAGKWTMSMETQQGSMPATLEFKVDGKKVTGTLNGNQGETALEGEFADGKLTFAISVQTPNGSFNIAFTGALKDDGTLAGSASLGDMGSMSWTAARAK